MYVCVSVNKTQRELAGQRMPRLQAIRYENPTKWDLKLNFKVLSHISVFEMYSISTRRRLCLYLSYIVSYNMSAIVTVVISLFISVFQEREGEEEVKPGMWEETFKTHSDSKPNGTALCTFTHLFMHTLFMHTAVFMHTVISPIINNVTNRSEHRSHYCFLPHPGLRH